MRLDEVSARRSRAISTAHTSLTVVQDRVKLAPANRARFVEACEQAYHFGKGKLAIHFSDAGRRNASTRKSLFQSPALRRVRYRIPRAVACACSVSIIRSAPARPAKVSGASSPLITTWRFPTGRETLAEGVVKPWQTGHGAGIAKRFDADVPAASKFRPMCRSRSCRRNGRTLSSKAIPDYGKDEEHEWPRAWYGVKGYFRWLESKAYKMHVRVLLSRYRAYTTCPIATAAVSAGNVALPSLRRQTTLTVVSLCWKREKRQALD